MLKSSSEFVGFFVAAYAAYVAQDAVGAGFAESESKATTHTKVLSRMVVTAVVFAGCAACVKGFNDYLFDSAE